MIRDIVDINDFIVLIEHAHSSKIEVDTCGFNQEAIGIAFYGSGKVNLKMGHGSHMLDFENTKGKVISFYGDTQSFYEHTVFPDQPLQCICIVTSLANLKKLSKEEFAIYEQYLSPLINPENAIVRGPEFLINPEMQLAVSKIFSTTYQGAMRTMFLRSQVTELLSHFFAKLAAGPSDQIDPEEQKKLYEAKAILEEKMAEPPSLNELSKLIGLNSYKLKKNFKELFGVPVFKHLQNERLNKAHHLLKEANYGIQEAAWAVGYESLSSFSNAFSKKFGFRPSEVSR